MFVGMRCRQRHNGISNKFENILANGGRRCITMRLFLLFPKSQNLKHHSVFHPKNEFYLKLAINEEPITNMDV